MFKKISQSLFFSDAMNEEELKGESVQKLLEFFFADEGGDVFFFFRIRDAAATIQEMPRADTLMCQGDVFSLFSLLVFFNFLGGASSSSYCYRAKITK